MKKLLLVAALPLLLVGCGTKENFDWKTLKEDEFVEVHFAEESRRYVATADIEVKYQFIAYSSVAEVYVEQKYSNGQKHTDYYIGTDITVYHYEV